MAILRVRAGDHEFRLKIDLTAGFWRFGDETQMPLKPGDRWQIGNITLEVEGEDERWAAASPVQPESPTLRDVVPREPAAQPRPFQPLVRSEAPISPPVAAPGADTLAAVKPPAFIATTAPAPSATAAPQQAAVAEVVEPQVAAPPVPDVLVEVAHTAALPTAVVPQESVAAELTKTEEVPVAAAAEEMPPTPAPQPPEPEAAVEPAVGGLVRPELEVAETPTPVEAVSAEVAGASEAVVEVEETVEEPRAQAAPVELAEAPEGPVSATIVEVPLSAPTEATGTLVEEPVDLPPPPPPPVLAPWEALPVREQIQPVREVEPDRPLPPPVPVQVAAPEARAVPVAPIEPPPVAHRTSQTAPLAPEDVTPISTEARPLDAPATQMLSESMAGELKMDRTVQVDTPPVYKVIVTFDNVTFEHILFRDMTKIGRDQSNDLVLPDTSISRYHATITRAPDFSYAIKDLNSTNGTIVNGTQVESAVLKDGDEVDLGNYKLRVVSSSPSGRFVARTAPAPQPPPAMGPGAPPLPPPSMPEAGRVAAQAGAAARGPGGPAPGRPRPPMPPPHRPGPPQHPAPGKPGLFGRLFGKKG